jgi:sarcosine oxidase
MKVASPRIAVIGLGSAGSMALWRLAARGADVVGFEQFGTGHDRGAHGGESRIFRTAYFEDSEYVPMLRQAHRLWRQLEDAAGVALLTLTGLLMIGDSRSAQMSNVVAAIDRFQVDAEPVSLAEARRRWPHHPLRDANLVIFDREAGYLRPELAVRHAARQAELLGAELRTYTTVTDLSIETGGVGVRTEEGSERFDHAVVTTGPWASRLLGPLASCVEVRRLFSAWFAARQPDAFQPGRFPPFGRTTPPECYGLPALDGTGLKLGLLDARSEPVADPGRLDRNLPVAEIRALRELVGTYFPDLHADPHRVTTYMDGFTPDGHGLVGPLPGTDRVTVVTGLSGHGFKLAPALGDIAADYSLAGRSSSNLALLDPGRFAGMRDSTGPFTS